MKNSQIIIENIFRLAILRKLEIEFFDKIFCSILIIKTRLKLIMALLDIKYSVVTSSMIEGILSSATEINIIKTNVVCVFGKVNSLSYLFFKFFFASSLLILYNFTSFTLEL